MSARDAVFTLLSTDLILKQEWNIDGDRIWPAQTVDTAPRNGHFLVLRWEETTVAPGGASGSQVLTVWAHISKEESSDYTKLDAILKRVRTILTEAIHIEGADGVLTCTDFRGFSQDFDDPVFRTITRNAAFRIISR